MSVAMKPGATALTVMPRLASSRAVLGEADYAGLGGGVVGLTGIAHQPHYRGDVDDPPLLLLQHRAGHRPVQRNTPRD